MSESGYVNWADEAGLPVWSFRWQLMNCPDVEGIVILGALYRGRLVLAKASLAGFRTHYPPVNAAGQPQQEYKIRDPLPYEGTDPHADLMFELSPGNKACPNDRRVCVSAVTAYDHEGVILQAYYDKKIGNYRLTQQWIFWDDGRISPRMYSRGVQHPEDHTHHMYWRFDFAIDGVDNNQILARPALLDEDWVPIATETTALKPDDAGAAWAVRQKDTDRGYYICPGPHDGMADSFAQHDLWVMRYHVEEDCHGTNFTPCDDRLARWVNGEDVDGQHIVVWYCAHLFHHLPELEEEWHGAGPELVPFQLAAPSLSLSVHALEETPCGILTIGNSIVVTARVGGLNPIDPTVRYHWAVTGGAVVGALDQITHPKAHASDAFWVVDSSQIRINNVAADVLVSCSVQVQDQTVSRSLHLTPQTASDVAALREICEHITTLERIAEGIEGNSIINSIINPLGPDAPSDLQGLLRSPAGIVELNRLARELVSATASTEAIQALHSVASDIAAETRRLLIS